jgi:hypothetical protein
MSIMDFWKVDHGFWNIWSWILKSRSWMFEKSKTWILKTLIGNVGRRYHESGNIGHKRSPIICSCCYLFRMLLYIDHISNASHYFVTLRQSRATCSSRAAQSSRYPRAWFTYRFVFLFMPCAAFLSCRYMFVCLPRASREHVRFACHTVPRSEPLCYWCLCVCLARPASMFGLRVLPFRVRSHYVICVCVCLARPANIFGLLVCVCLARPASDWSIQWWGSKTVAILMGGATVRR